MIHRDRTPRENEGKIVFYARSLSSFLLYHRSSRTDVLFFWEKGRRPPRKWWFKEKMIRKNRPFGRGVLKNVLSIFYKNALSKRTTTHHPTKTTVFFCNSKTMCDSTRVDDKTNAPRLYLTHGLRRTRRQFRTTGRRIRIHLLHDARFRAGSSGGRATTFVAHLLLQFFSKAPPTERRRKTNLLLLLLLPLLVTLDGCVARATRATRLSLYRKKESRAMRVRVRSVLMRAQKRKALRGKFIMTLRKRLVVLSNVYKKNDTRGRKYKIFTP